MLKESIPPLFKQSKNSKYDIEIIVADNNSSDESIEYLSKEFPEIKILKLDRNYGFSGGCNMGAEHASGEILIFLNNDMVICENFFEPLINPMIDTADIFAVSSQILMDVNSKEKRREETGLTRAEWREGKLGIYHHDPEGLDKPDKEMPCLYAGGGSSAIRKDMFQELGGFDPIYEPFYFEDTDLSTRAWKRGWRVLFAKNSKAIHKHRSTISRDFNEEFISKTIKKNRFIYILQHFDVLSLISNLWMNLIEIFFIDKKSRTTVIESFSEVSSSLKGILQRIIDESKVKKKYKIKQVLDISANPFSYHEQYTPPREFEADEPLDILMLTPYLPCQKNHAGAGRMFELIKRLSDKHNIDVLSFYDSEFEENSIPVLQSLCKNLSTIKRVPTKRDDFFPLPKPSDLKDFYQVDMLKKLRQCLNNKDYHIIHIEYQIMAQYLPKSKRIRKFLTIHENGFSAIKNKINNEQSLLKKTNLFLEFIKSFVFEIIQYRKFDALITVTSEESKKIEPFVGNENIFVVNTGVDCEALNDQKRKIRKIPDDPVLLYVGYYGHKPNVDAVNFFAKEIFPEILSNYPKATFIIAGNDPFKWVKHFHNNKNIICTGFVGDMKPYFNKADIFVVPLRLGGGIRGKLLEAFAMRLSVIATSLSTQGLEVENGKHLFIVNGKDEFTSKTITLIEDVNLRRRFSLAGRELVEKMYDWGRKARELEAIYKDLLEKRRRSG